MRRESVTDEELCVIEPEDVSSNRDRSRMPQRFLLAGRGEMWTNAAWTTEFPLGTEDTFC